MVIHYSKLPAECSHWTFKNSEFIFSRISKLEHLCCKWSSSVCEIWFYLFLLMRNCSPLLPYGLTKWSGICDGSNQEAHVSTGLLLCMRPTFMKWVCNVAVAVSKLSCTNIIFAKRGFKISRQYYQDMILMQELLPVIYSIAEDVFLFRQDNAPTHCPRLLCHDTPHSLILICC